jgi:hypothetical protein
LFGGHFCLDLTPKRNVQIKIGRPGAGTVSERLPADSVAEVFTKSGFNPSEDSDFRARKVSVIEYHTHAKQFIPKGEWIYYTAPPSVE